MSLYEVLVPSSKKMLGNLERWLDAGVALAEKKKFDPNVLLQARLAPDQFRSFARSNRLATRRSSRWLGSVRDPTPLTPTRVDRRGCGRGSTVIAYLDTYTPADFGGVEDRVLELRALAEAEDPRRELRVRAAAPELLLSRHDRVRHPASQRRGPRQARLSGTCHARRVARSAKTPRFRDASRAAPDEVSSSPTPLLEHRLPAHRSGPIVGCRGSSTTEEGET